MKLNIAQFVLIILLTIFVYGVWLFSPVIAAGDWWYYFPNMFENHFTQPFAWSTYTSVNGLGGQGFAYIPTYLLIGNVQEGAKILGLSWAVASKLFFYIPFVFISISSSIFLLKKLFPENPYWIFAPLIFVFNTYALMLVGGGQILTGISYAFLPVTLLVFMFLLNEKLLTKQRAGFYITAGAILFSIQCLFDLRIAYITAVAIGIYILVKFLFKELRIKNLITVFVSFIMIAFINFYWISPLVLLGVDPIRELGSNYSSTKIVEFLSFAKLENSIGLMHPYWPENIFGKIGFMKAEFLLLPILAFSSLFFIKKKSDESKYILFFSLVGLLGIFLGKGASDPLGNIYTWLFSNLPGFQLFRDSFKWYTLIILSYSVLIPFTIYEISKLISSKDKIFKKNKIISFSNIFVFLILVYLIFLIHPAVIGRLGGTFQAKNIPQEYSSLNNYLDNDKNFYRALWIPNTMLFGTFTNNHPQISARDFFNQYDHKKLIRKINSEESKNILSNSSVKYVIVPKDTEREIYLTERKYDPIKYEYIVKSLDNIDWLTRDREFGEVIVYKTTENRDHFWCDCGANISFKFINPTKYEIDIKNAKNGDILIFSEQFDKNWVANGESFSISSEPYEKRFNSFKIPEGSHKITVEYASQSLINSAFKISLISFIVTISVFIFCLIKKWK
jgi:hypothetical protein